MDFFLSKIDRHTFEVIKKSSHSLIVKVISVLLGLLLSIFLGRILGPTDFGILNLSNKIIQVLIILGLFGFRQVIMKAVAINYNSDSPKKTFDVMFTSYLFNGVLSLTLSIIFISITPYISESVFKEPRLTWPLIISIIALTPQVLSRIFSGALIGYRKIWQSNLVDNTLSTFVLFLFLLILYFLNVELDILNISICYAISRIIVMLTVGFYWRSLNIHLPNFKTNFVLSKLYKSAFALFIVSLTSVIFLNADAIMIGWLGNSTMVGLYTVAAKIAMLTIFFLQITISAISPKIAHLFAENKLLQLEKLVQNITFGLTIVALITLGIIILFGKLILGFWGKEFVEGYNSLVILSIGQFFNIATGASGAVLMMCGLQNEYARFSVILVILNLAFNYFLIKDFGIVGAAISTSITIIIDNLLRVFLSRKKLGIWIVPVNLINRKND